MFIYIKFFLLQISLPAYNTQWTSIQRLEKDLMALSVMVNGNHNIYGYSY